MEIHAARTTRSAIIRRARSTDRGALVMATFDASDDREPEFSRTDAVLFLRELRSRLQNQPHARRFTLERIEILMLLSTIDDLLDDEDDDL